MPGSFPQREKPTNTDINDSSSNNNSNSNSNSSNSSNNDNNKYNTKLTSPESSNSAKDTVPSARHVGGSRHPTRRAPAEVSSPLRAKNGNRATKKSMVPMVEAVLARLKNAETRQNTRVRWEDVRRGPSGGLRDCTHGQRGGRDRQMRRLCGSTVLSRPPRSVLTSPSRCSALWDKKEDDATTSVNPLASLGLRTLVRSGGGTGHEYSRSTCMAKKERYPDDATERHHRGIWPTTEVCSRFQRPSRRSHSLFGEEHKTTENTHKQEARSEAGGGATMALRVASPPRSGRILDDEAPYRWAERVRKWQPHRVSALSVVMPSTSYGIYLSHQPRRSRRPYSP